MPRRKKVEVVVEETVEQVEPIVEPVLVVDTADKAPETNINAYIADVQDKMIKVNQALAEANDALLALIAKIG